MTMTPEALKALRISLGLDQTQMANALGYSRAAQISDLERGKLPITTQTALLAEAYASGWRPASWAQITRALP